MIAQEQRRPSATCQHHLRRRDTPLFRDHPGNPPRRDIKAAHGAILDDLNPLSRGDTGESGHRDPRLRPHVRRGDQRADLRCGKAGEHGGDLGRRHHPAVRAIGPRMGQPVFVARKLCRPLRQIGNAALPQPDIHVRLPRKVAPERLRLGHDRHLVRVAPLLPDPPPIAAGLFSGDATLFQQGDRVTLPGEEQRRADPDDPAADNNDIRRGWLGAGIGDGGGRMDRERLHGSGFILRRRRGQSRPGSGASPRCRAAAPPPGCDAIWKKGAAALCHFKRSSRSRMNLWPASNCATSIYSLGWCACAISPGPQITALYPASWNCPASVP